MGGREGARKGRKREREREKRTVVSKKSYFSVLTSSCATSHDDNHDETNATLSNTRHIIAQHGQPYIRTHQIDRKGHEPEIHYLLYILCYIWIY